MDYLKINLHALRTYAKDIGVKSPSIYTKSVLIEKIKAVESGKTKPYFSKRGRPNSERLSVCDKNTQKNKSKPKKRHTFCDKQGKSVFR